jgi:hypothetical protein
VRPAPAGTAPGRGGGARTRQAAPSRLGVGTIGVAEVMDVKDITDQSLGSLLADFLVCPHCQIIDRDRERTRSGYKCSTCGMPGRGGRLYFESSILVLIDLMQEAFHSQPNRSIEESEGATYEAHNVSVVLFFCTLREVLMNWLIQHLFWALKIPERLQKRLVADSNTYSKKQNDLLPSLIGRKWRAAIESASHDAAMDYVELDGFLQKAVEARNKFMHEGRHWGINRTMANGCIDHTWPLLNLYVALHNKHVHPLVYRTANP